MAGTPGACSQVFCHPIRCMLVMRYRQRYVINTPSVPQPPHKAQTGCSVCVGDFCCAFEWSTMDGVGNATGAAMRRRQRRLRSMLRHERMTVAMALAESTHLTSRGQKYARAVWGHEQNYTAKIRKPPTPQPELFSLEEETGGGLPAPLSGVAGRQGKVVRHVMEDLGSVCPVRADSRSSCAADGWRRYRHLAAPGFPDCRAGYRSAQDLLLSVSFSFSVS